MAAEVSNEEKPVSVTYKENGTAVNSLLGALKGSKRRGRPQ